MIRPSWQRYLSAAGKRHRVSLILNEEPITVDILGESTMAIMQGSHNGRNIRPSDVIWIKSMRPDNVTINEAQFFSEGILGGERAVERVAFVEGGKSEALNASANQITKDLLELLKAENDHHLATLFEPHILFLEIFEGGSQTELAYRELLTENPRRIKHFLKQCLTVKDRTGRRNPHSKVFGTKSALQRMRAMSTRRMRNSQNALVQSITLNTIVKAIRGLIAEIYSEVQSKLSANTWSMRENHRRWLNAFAKKLAEWAEELKHVDMHPFQQDTERIRYFLKRGAECIREATEKRVYEKLVFARPLLGNALSHCKYIEARFRIADSLRVVGTARDSRVLQLGLSIEQPQWEKIDSDVDAVRRTWSEIITLPDLKATEREPLTYYTALRNIARAYDRRVYTPQEK